MKETRWSVRLAPVLLVCLLVLCAHSSPAQSGSAATQPAPKPHTRGRASTSKPPKIHASERVIDSSIPEDRAVNAVIAPYSARVRALNVVIGKLSADIVRSGMGGGAMGNLVVDAIRSRAQVKLGRPVTLALTNYGGLRKKQFPAGDIMELDIFQLLPFENALVTVDLTGEQLLRLLQVVVAERDAQSGARLTYRRTEQGYNLISAKIGDSPNSLADIDPAATYQIVTSDYLVKRGGRYAILGEGRNVTPLDLTIRDAVSDYIKAETAAGRAIRPALDDRYVFDRQSSTVTTTQEEEP
ncbi:MAG TPA: 5'-nucleotidase C-terminal domain-containing protein [Pyrinomonadaceae bacterium]|nr:5'-nucleotidase C-terminal domain-containing protein [Pyrinomonadaceae bacterium]